MENRQDLNQQIALAHKSALWTERQLQRTLRQIVRIEQSPDFFLLDKEYEEAVGRYYYLCSKALFERQLFAKIVRRMINLD